MASSSPPSVSSTAGEIEQDRPLPGPAPRRRVLLVANANASGLARHPELFEAAGRLLALAGADVEARLTTSLVELEELLRAHPERRLVLLGGDGTAHAVVNLSGPRREIALLPVGGANNIAGSVGIPLDLRAAAELAVRGVARPLDVIAATSDGRRYLAVEGVSVGLLALARAGYRARNSADLAVAARAGLAALRRFDPFCVAVESRQAGERLRVGQLFVANLPLYSFGLRVAPLADPWDGLLDLTAIEARNRLSLLVTLARLRRRPERSCPGYRCWRESSVRIDTGGRSPVIADSKNLGPGPVELSVVRGAFELVVPAG